GDLDGDVLAVSLAPGGQQGAEAASRHRALHLIPGNGQRRRRHEGRRLGGGGPPGTAEMAPRPPPPAGHAAWHWLSPLESRINKTQLYQKRSGNSLYYWKIHLPGAPQRNRSEYSGMAWGEGTEGNES